MDYFYIIVGSIAIGILVAALAFLGTAMNKQYVTRPIPARTLQKCPDYWKIGDDGKCIIPTQADNPSGMNNIGDLNSVSLTITKASQFDRLFTPGFTAATKTIDFDDAVWESKPYNTMVGTNLNPVCQKQQWLNEHKIVWDGISNSNIC